jgi:hypothetical protein
MLQEMNFSATVEQVDDVLAGKLIFIDWKSGMASHVYLPSLFSNQRWKSQRIKIHRLGYSLSIDI